MDDGGERHVKLLHDYVHRVCSLITAHRVWTDQQHRDDERSFHLYSSSADSAAVAPAVRDASCCCSVLITLHAPQQSALVVEEWTICVQRNEDEDENKHDATGQPLSTAALAKLHKQCVASLRCILVATHALPAFHWYKACARTRGSSHHLQMTTMHSSSINDASPSAAAIGGHTKHKTVACFAAGAHRVRIHVGYITAYPSPPTCTAPLVRVASGAMQCDDVRQFLQLCTSPPPLDILRDTLSRSNTTVATGGAASATRLFGSRHGAAQTEQQQCEQAR